MSINQISVVWLGDILWRSYGLFLKISIELIHKINSVMVGEGMAAMRFEKLELTKLANRLNKPKDKVTFEQ